MGAPSEFLAYHAKSRAFFPALLPFGNETDCLGEELRDEDLVVMVVCGEALAPLRLMFAFPRLRLPTQLRSIRVHIAQFIFCLHL